MGIEFQFYKMKKVLVMDGGDGFKMMGMYLVPLNCILVKMVHFVLCIFYHNLKNRNRK